jgi:hypothetical protein
LAWLVLGAELAAPLLLELVVLVWTIPVPLMTWPIVCVPAPPELAAELGVAAELEGLLALVEFDDGAAARAVRACPDLLPTWTIAAVSWLALVAAPLWPGGAPPGSGTGALGLLGSVVVTPGWLGPRKA